MAKKDSGLGRGLGNLLLDNTPDVRVGGSVIKRDGSREVNVSNTGSASDMPISVVKNAGNYTAQASTPQVFAQVEPITAKNESVIIEQLSIDSIEPTVITAGSAQQEDETPVAPRKSLKALFREYK